MFFCLFPDFLVDGVRFFLNRIASLMYFIVGKFLEPWGRYLQQTYTISEIRP